MRWPEWWAWELELTPHVERRMEDRGFSEVDLRTMLHVAWGMRADVAEGRWVVETHFSGQSWEVVVEPDEQNQRLVIVTAYGVGR